MKCLFRIGVGVAMALLLFPYPTVRAADRSEKGEKVEKSDAFEYPELLVTPSASKRLKMEAAQEEKSVWTSHWPVQTSALMTLTAGVLGMGDAGNKNDKTDANGQKVKSDAKPSVYYAGLAGIGVGTGWLVTTVLFSSSYRPYQTGQKEIGKLPDKDRKDALMKERFAEEYIEKPASIGSRLMWISVFTNFGTGVAIAASAGADETKVAGGLAAVLAFTPLLFQYRWQQVMNYHEEYKKKIYGPLSDVRFSIDPIILVHDEALSPGVNLALSF